MTELNQARWAAVEQGEVAQGARYVAALDGLRAFAIGTVWLLHFDRPVFPGGAVGVDVFFALSAYLITGILLREIQRGRLNLVAFYLRRVFRLVPALLVWLVLFAIPTVLLVHQGSLLRWSVPGVVLYFNDFLEGLTRQVPGPIDQSWSLAVEEQFYLLWPVLLLLAVRAGRQSAGFFLLVAVGAVLEFMSPNYFLPTGHLFPLAAGAAAAWAAQTGRIKASPGISVVTASLALLVAADFVVFDGAASGGLERMLTSAAAVILITHCDLQAGSPVSRLFGTRVLAWIGARAYGIYLYGLTILSLVPAITHWSMHVVLVPDLVLTLLVVELSYRFIESPIRRRGREWLMRRTRGRDAARDPAAITQPDDHVVEITPS